MSKPEGAVHLLAADEAARRGYLGATYVTVCGEVVHASDLVPADCECDHQYCPACVQAAIRWSAETRRQPGPQVQPLLTAGEHPPDRG